jgi:hypothetical protein
MSLTIFIAPISCRPSRGSRFQRTNALLAFLTLSVSAMLFLQAFRTEAATDSAAGPLRPHPGNPRYFTDGTKLPDGSLRAVYLGGHQIFVDLQDNSFNKEWTKDLSRPDDSTARARLLDWDRYLEFLEQHKFNYVRNWIIWSTGSGTAAPPHRIASHMPFRRMGPGKASDGKLKFDLTQLDDAFFQRLRDRARALESRGVYLSIMLFELYGFLDGEDENGQRLWEGNMFHSANNVNGIDVDRNRNRLGEEFFTLDDPRVLGIQQAYIEKMVDTLNDLDNVVWEICNEPPSDSIEWQYEMVRRLKAYQAAKPKQHPVLLSPGGWTRNGWKLAPEDKYLQSEADCIATANGWIDVANPKAYRIGKPVFLDTDHAHPGIHDPALIWRAFTRGYHFNLYDQPFEAPGKESPAWQLARINIRQTRLLAESAMDLTAMTPSEDLASSRFCLANKGKEYIVYCHGQDAVRMEGLIPGQSYRYEWFDTARGSVHETGRVTSNSSALSIRPPFARGVLFLTIAGP